MPRLHKAIDEYFEKAPKSLEELKSSPDYVPPIPPGMTYKEFKQDEDILTLSFYKHNDKKCNCKLGKKCLFKLYEDKEINREKLLKRYKKNALKKRS